MSSTVNPAPVSWLVAETIIRSCRMFTGLHTRWLYSLFENNKVRIYYANHSSLLDTVIIWGSVPAEFRHSVRIVGAADYWLASSFRSYIARRIFNAILIDRSYPGDNSQIRNNALCLMNDALKKAQSLIIFPEGTRGNGEKISCFKSGLWHLARKNPGVELVPVYLENLNRVLPKGSGLLVPVLCSVTFGEPIQPLKRNEEKIAFLQRARDALEQLKP